MRDNQQSNLEQIELLEVAADVPTNPCLGSAVQLNHIGSEAIHAPSQPLHGPPVDINQNTTVSDNSLAPEFPRIDIATTAPEPSARIHEMMPFENIFPSNFLFPNRRKISASHRPLPADVPEMPAMRSQLSSSKRSSTPQVNAPWEPPPWRARSIRTGLLPLLRVRLIMFPGLITLWRFYVRAA